MSANIRAIVWMLASCLLLGVMWALIRLASQDMHPFVVATWRNILGALWLMPMVIIQPSLIHSNGLSAYLKRAGSGLVSVLGLFYAIANAPLAQVLAINYTAPLFATLGAALFLGERIRKVRIMLLMLGFSGMLIVLRPGASPINLGLIAAVISAWSIAFTYLAMKQLVGTDDPRTVTIWGFLLAIPLSLPFALPFWSWPTASGWGYLIALGGAAALGQLALIKALELTDMSTILPFDFLRFALVTLFGIFLFGESYDSLTIIGGMVILLSTVLIALREYQLREKRQNSRSPAE